MSLIKRGDGDIADRYRPRKFGEIIGNAANVKALLGDLKEGDRRSKCTIFIGSSGSGKTTTARIMAMALNCEKGDTDPCLECNNCKAALEGNAMHIMEMNLSKLNTKEDAEEITNNMYLTSLTGRNKVYIFDECQMLSTAAQNLLLKNLEEPPLNTYIILCTTDPQKIIEAIRNRCQKYEFKYPSEAQLKVILKSVMEQEKWTMSEADKTLFFEYAIGLSIREVLKALDQAVKGGIESLVNLTFEKAEYIEVCRLLLSANFKGICDKLKILEKDKQLEAEQLRCVIMGYLKAILVSSGMSEKGAMVCEAMKIFSTPYYEAKPIPKLYKDCFEACTFLGQVGK